MTAAEEALRVVGACLRDARHRRMMLPEQPAELLGVPPETVLAMEHGSLPLHDTTITALTRLYRCGQDTEALNLLVAIGGQQPVRDSEPGHARRMTACARQATAVRWLSTVLIPAPLQTPAYARAVEEHSTVLRGAPLASADTLYVLDSRVIERGDEGDLMAGQLAHLLALADAGTAIRIVAPHHPVPQPPGHLVEMTLPAGLVLARPQGTSVDYEHSAAGSPQIDDALALTNQSLSRAALERAAAHHHVRAATTPVHRPAQSVTPSKETHVR